MQVISQFTYGLDHKLNAPDGNKNEMSYSVPEINTLPFFTLYDVPSFRHVPPVISYAVPPIKVFPAMVSPHSYVQLITPLTVGAVSVLYNADARYLAVV